MAECEREARPIPTGQTGRAFAGCSQYGSRVKVYLEKFRIRPSQRTENVGLQSKDDLISSHVYTQVDAHFAILYKSAFNLEI